MVPLRYRYGVGKVSLKLLRFLFKYAIAKKPFQLITKKIVNTIKNNTDTTSFILLSNGSCNLKTSMNTCLFRSLAPRVFFRITAVASGSAV